MSLSSPSPPTPHDPLATADTQNTFNLGAAAASQSASAVNQSTPYGSLTYTQTGTGPGGIPLYTATSTLSPDQQAILTALQGAQKTAGTQAGDVLASANYGAPNTTVADQTSKLTSDLLAKQTAYLSPFFTQQTDQLDTKLRNQGVAPGNPAYDIAMNQLKQSQNQTVTGYLSTAEPAAFSQAMQTYTMPLQIAGQELGLSQPASLPGSLVPTPTANVQPPNYTGAVSSADQAAMTAYQAQMQQQSNMMSGLFGIPTAILGGWARGGFANPFAAVSGGGTQ